MAFILINIFFLTYFVITECSQVTDIQVQKSINVTDYCSDFAGCEEGTHVMCLHYNPNRIMGPACSDAVNITITPDYAELILGVMNKIRSRVTKGIIKGRGGVNLPRAYGVYRLSWDEELATFAQVWANQCKLASDLCRASKKFPKVGQALGLSRFTVYGWRPISLPDSPNSTTITPEKVKYAITSVMSAWYSTKDQVTPEHIKQFGDGSKRMLQNQFLHLVYENVTHIGCGISAYREYVYHSDHAPLYHNSVQIVCNFSSRFQAGTRIYTTEPPTQTGFTVRCGCPLGYDEDEDCLCYESGRQLPYSCKNNNRCKPPVVVLPIFHVEDAPKELRNFGYDKRNRNNNATLLMKTNDLFDRYDVVNNHKTNNKHGMTNNFDRYRKSKTSLRMLDLESKLVRDDSVTKSVIRRGERNLRGRYKLDGAKEVLLQSCGLKRTRFSSKVDTYHADVRRRYFDINRGLRKNRHRTFTPYHVPKIEKSQRSRQSIFSMAPIFELSVRKTNPIKHQKIVKSYKKDVTPRRDFTEAKKLLSTYVDKKRSSNAFNIDRESDGPFSHGAMIIDSDSNRYISKGVKDSRKNYDGHQNISFDDHNLTTVQSETRNIELQNKVTDTTLATLLNKLETEISEKPLNIKEKEIFDNKIRKIYGTVIGKSDIKEKFKLIADSKNNSNIYEIDNYYLKPDRDEYFESITPKDKYHGLKRKFGNYKIQSNFSKDNDNTGLIDHPTLNEKYNEFENIEMRDLYDVRKRPETHFRKDLGVRNFYLRNFDDEDFIDIDRRKYYENKLANLRKKVDLMKIDRYKNKVRKDRKLRPVRPTKPVEDQNTQLRPKEALNSFYVADRARFIHGF